MNWLALVLIGHLFNAGAFVIDKVLLSKSFTNPFVYAFFIGLLGSLVVVFIPLGFDWPGLPLLLLNAAAGILFIVSLLLFFFALRGAAASRIVPFIGGGIPVFTLIFELLFLDGSFSSRQLIAFAILVIGTIIIAIDVDAKPTAQKDKRTWLLGLLAAISFALSFGLSKAAYDSQPFWSAFIWQRLWSLGFVLLFLVWPRLRQAIRAAIPTLKTTSGAVFLASQSMGAGGFIFINLAIAKASVSLVNALQGVQYGFLLILAVLGSIVKPGLLRESMSRTAFIQRSIAVVIIAIGLWLLAS